MGLQQSKEELLYQQVNYGNADGIRTLRAQGAGLEVSRQPSQDDKLLRPHITAPTPRLTAAADVCVLGLQWIDKEGKTPLMVACTRPDLLNVAKVLIELGANVNAYRPGTGALLLPFFLLHLVQLSTAVPMAQYWGLHRFSGPDRDVFLLVWF